MKNRLNLLILALVLVAAFTLTACSSNNETKDVQGNIEDDKNIETPKEDSETDSTITIKHKLGEAVVNKNPKKVIVFDYATLDSLDKMGVEILALPKANIPHFLEKYNDDKYEDVGTLFEPRSWKSWEKSYLRIYIRKKPPIYFSNR